MNNLQRIIAVLLVTVSAVAIAQRDVGDKDFSGWLEDYDSLVFNEKRNAFIFSKKEKAGTYEKVLLQPIELFSATGKADTDRAREAIEYLNNGLLKILEEKGIAATEPGPKVARLRLAITGVEKSKEELKARNLIPVSAVFRGAQAATGNLSTYIATMFEAEAVDSMSGERVMAIVTKGIDETEKRSGDELTFEDFKPTLDLWLERYALTMDEFLAKRDGS
jgi:Cft2 family RNA processing exonuclease